MLCPPDTAQTPNRPGPKNPTEMKATLVRFAALCGLTFTPALGQAPDTIYRNGSILTMAGSARPMSKPCR